MKLILLLLATTLFSWGLSTSDRYPSYRYVFNEFDVYSDYINNDDFVAFVQSKDKKYRNFYKNSLDRGGYLIPTFKSMLMRDGLSDLFAYMSIVESGLALDATSNKNAVGIWQFMSATAKQYKLNVYSDFDERLDPILSTSAAMRYLHKLHKDFGKWYLVAMAYNCGEGRLKKAIARAGTDDITVLMDEKAAYIPKETREYLKRILLVSMIGENISLGFETMGGAVEQLYGRGVVQVEVDAGERLENIAKLIGMKSKELKKLNHHFKKGVVPVKLPSYKMNIPDTKMVDFYALYILRKELDRVERTHFLSHCVVKKESLSKIATQYQTTIATLMLTNGLKKNKLQVGESLIVPVTKQVFMKYSETKGQ